MADDDIYPPEYYPRQWIEISINEIEALPMDLIKNYMTSYPIRQKGEWKRFSNEIKETWRWHMKVEMGKWTEQIYFFYKVEACLFYFKMW